MIRPTSNTKFFFFILKSSVKLSLQIFVYFPFLPPPPKIFPNILTYIHNFKIKNKNKSKGLILYLRDNLVRPTSYFTYPVFLFQSLTVRSQEPLASISLASKARELTPLK